MIVRAAQLIVTAAFFTTSIVGATQLEEYFEFTSFIPSDSYLQEFCRIDEQYFGDLGITVDIIIEDPPYETDDVQDALAQLVNSTRDFRFTNGVVDDWYTAFIAWLPTPASGFNTTLRPNGRPPVGQFYAQLRTFLDSAGSRFNNDIRWTDSSRVRPSSNICGC